MNPGETDVDQKQQEPSLPVFKTLQVRNLAVLISDFVGDLEDF